MATPNKLTHITKEQWEEMYVTQRCGSGEMAKSLGCDQKSVLYQLKKHGIEIRRKSEAVRLSRQKKQWPLTGKDHHNFKHGLSSDGYPQSYHEGKPRKHHRAIAEQLLGCSLSAQEHVHHCNEIRTDNRPENLWVFPNQSAHSKYHKTGTIHPDTIFLKDYTKQNTEEDQ